MSHDGMKVNKNGEKQRTKVLVEMMMASSLGGLMTMNTSQRETRKGTYAQRGRAKVSGWLYKLRRTHDSETSIRLLSKHQFTSAWSHRYFTIEKDMLKWYTSDKNRTQVSGFINFHEIISIRVLNCESRHVDKFFRDEYGTYGFQINALSRKLVLRAENRKDARRWVEALRQYLKLWTNRSGVETIRELAKKTKKSTEPVDYLLNRVEDTWNKLEQAEQHNQQQEEEEEAKQVRNEGEDRFHEVLKSSRKTFKAPKPMCRPRTAPMKMLVVEDLDSDA